MFRKIKQILKYLKSYKLSNSENEFIKLNSEIWKSSSSPNKTNKICLIEGHIDCPASIIDKARMAKAIEESTGAKPVVYIRGFSLKGSNVAHIYKSFNIQEFYLWWNSYLNPFIVIPSIFKTMNIYLFTRSGENLLKIKYKGVYIGDLIYDTLIRFKPNSYTLDNIKIEHIRLILRAFITFNINNKLIKKYNPTYLVTSHNVYAEFGMLPRQIRHNNNGIVFLKDIYAYKCYDIKTPINEHFLKVRRSDFQEKLICDDYYSNARKYFKERMLGNINQIDVKNAFTNKKPYKISDLKIIHPKIDINKKNVIVMSHAFSDSPHVGEGLLFKDYYDFLEKTLIRLNDNNEINCFVKTHPSSYMWNEKGGVEHLIEKNKLSNIYILPNDLNTNSICELANYIVTAKGTAGLEFSCLGIPAITAGKGFYYGFDITKEPNSISEYYNYLDTICYIPKLTEETKRKALVLLYMVSQNKHHSKILPDQHIMPGENYHEIYQEKFHEIVNNMKKGEVMKDDYYQMVLNDAAKCND